MIRFAKSPLVPLVFLACGGFVGTAGAVTIPVSFNVLNASATLATPFSAGDDLRLNTLVTTETGALLQAITFTLAAGVTDMTGEAAWEISSATGTGPRLVGVNIDIFNAGNVLVASDSFAGTLGRFAMSTFDGAIGPGTYRMVASGTGVRASSLDVTLSFIGTAPVPEPETYALMLVGLGAIGFVARRRR
jgi:PEP-CTERM motif